MIGVWQWCNLETALQISQNISRTSSSQKPVSSLKNFLFKQWEIEKKYYFVTKVDI
jgi:hypothetical protein